MAAHVSDPTAHVAGQQHHPSALRNRIPILKALLVILPDDIAGDALEIATGTGALLEVVAPGFPTLTFRPSEYVPAAAAAPEEQWSKHGKIGLRAGLDELANIDAHGRAIFPNCLPAIALDLREPWPAAVADASLSLVICANTLHITPWACSEGLFEHAARALKPGGHLCAYGPFKVDGAFVGDDGGAGNERFDAKLRSTNGAWGLRDVSDLAALAAQRGLRLAAKIPMPANNLTLHFIKN